MKYYGMVAVSVMALTACSAKNSGNDQSRPSEPAAGQNHMVRSIDGKFDGEVTGTPAPGSKFSRLQIGMPMKQVTDLIGEPTDSGANITGKAFIPFYFGNDTARIRSYYRNEGYLEFNAQRWGGTSYRLIGIHVDRNEQGYAR
jgi:hypothetical protein